MTPFQKEILDKMEPGLWYTSYELYANTKSMLALLRQNRVRMDREYKPGMHVHKCKFTRLS